MLVASDSHERASIDKEEVAKVFWGCFQLKLLNTTRTILDLGAPVN